MKKLLMVAAMLFAGLFTYCYGQNVNSSITYGHHGEYYINGICSDKDIGGVECVVNDCCVPAKVEFTNYNIMSVTVICVVDFQISYNNGVNYENSEKTFNFVLESKNSDGSSREFELGWPTRQEIVKGMIVRKLTQ